MLRDLAGRLRLRAGLWRRRASGLSTHRQPEVRTRGRARSDRPRRVRPGGTHDPQAWHGGAESPLLPRVPVGRRNLVAGLFRTGRRARPVGAAHLGRARRRRLDRQRSQGPDRPGPCRGVDDPARAHLQSARPRQPGPCPVPHRRTGGRDGLAAGQDDRRDRVRRRAVRRCPHPRRLPTGRGRPGLVGRDDDPAGRTRRIRNRGWRRGSVRTPKSSRNR